MSHRQYFESLKQYNFRKSMFGCLKSSWRLGALARISELGVQKYRFGGKWVSDSFSSHCINTQKTLDIAMRKISNRVSKRHPNTPLSKGLRRLLTLESVRNSYNKVILLVPDLHYNEVPLYQNVTMTELARFQYIHVAFTWYIGNSI